MFLQKIHLKGLLITLCTAAFLSLAALPAYAQETPCDPEFMEAMKARAWLEAQREITQNQNLITKPDSVLEYSCFRGFLNKAAMNFSINGLNRQFSETDQWETSGFSQTSTDQALSNVVGQALNSFLNQNFNHSALGGRLSSIDLSAQHSASVNGNQAYDCDVMARVWELARCQNFAQRTAQDFFYDFNYYMENDDPRNLPPGLESCTQLAGGSDNQALGRSQLQEAYNMAIGIAFNQEQDKFVMPASGDGNIDETPYETDNVQTHFNLILPDQGCEGEPIPTGIEVVRGGQTFPDKVCPTPGCTFDGQSCS